MPVETAKLSEANSQSSEYENDWNQSSAEPETMLSV